MDKRKIDEVKEPANEKASLPGPNEKEVKDLYHGGREESIRNIENRGIDLSRGRKNLDFNTQGEGAFYTSESLKETIKYNKRFKDALTDIAKFKIPKGELEKLNIKIFEEANEEWAKFVTSGRSGTLVHNYDIVVGPKLKNPLDVEIGGWRAAEPITRPMEIQVAITSQKAVDILNSNIIK